jgi:hypothetical protein
VDAAEVKPRIANHFGEVFGLAMRRGSREELIQQVERVEQAVEVPVS